MKVVIADDESLARVYLRSTLAEVDESLTVADEARNGEELLQLLEQHHPDVVFVDIRMPKLDGLRAIRRGKEISPHTQWVVLSGFSEFQYAQEAVELGVCHYLLKPVRPSDLRQSVELVKQKLAHSLTTLHHEFENGIVSLLHHCSQVTDFAPDSPLRNCPLTGYVLYVDGLPGQTPENHAYSSFVAEVRKCASDHLSGRDDRFGMTSLPDGQIAIIAASVSPAASASAALSASRFERAMMEVAERFGEQHRLFITPMASSRHSSIEPLLCELQQLLTLGALRAVLPIGRFLNLHDLESEHRLLPLGRRLCKIAERFHAGDYLDYSKELSLLAKELKPVALQNPLTFGNIRQFVERSLGVTAPDAKFEGWVRKLEMHGEKHLLQTTDHSQDSRDLVQIVIDYVDKHYMHDIGIGQIAQEIGVTYNYLSTLFHKKCGITFMNYLTKTRMLKAKQLLLSNPHMKIQKVASEVGYYSTRYFTKTFTKQFNCYPSEIRSGTQEM